jgi:hypothetical protein
MDKGFLIMAQGSDYETCAKALKLSIDRNMPNSNVTIVTTDMLPHGDQDPDTNWKLRNDWQAYEASPYEYTIKLEADMFLTRSIDHYWEILKDRDVVVSTTIRNFHQKISDVKVYRRFIYDNNLPDAYNSITYFRKSDTAKKFYDIVRDIFDNWTEYRKLFKCKIDEPCTTDWAYSIACHIMGVENTTLPQFTDMSMIHMKQFINELATNDWTDTLVPELLPHSFRINTVPQLYPVHYHIKSFANNLLEAYDGK